MTLKEADTICRENARNMLGSESLQSRYIAALNTLMVMAPAVSSAMLRLKPEAVKVGTKERREPL